MQRHKKKRKLKRKTKHKAHHCHQVFDPPPPPPPPPLPMPSRLQKKQLLLLLLQQPHLKKGKLAIWTGRQPASRLFLLEMQPAHRGASELKRQEFGIFQDVQVEKSS